MRGNVRKNKKKKSKLYLQWIVEIFCFPLLIILSQGIILLWQVRVNARPCILLLLYSRCVHWKSYSCFGLLFISLWWNIEGTEVKLYPLHSLCLVTDEVKSPSISCPSSLLNWAKCPAHTSQCQDLWTCHKKDILLELHAMVSNYL